MSAANGKIVRNAIKDFRKKMFDEVENHCIDFCDALCRAAVQYRKFLPDAHDFTGNLLNSIVVCLYRKKAPVYACYAADSIQKAIRVKMTPSERSGRRGVFHRRDYQGESSFYEPKVSTNRGWGEDDARRFFHSYKPNGSNQFDIVVAYPVEYANFVEQERGTTGILQTYAYAGRVGVSYLKLPKK